ncbi:4-hydroxy-tetrahydrodipicolinate reductase [Lyticum sinuosum]|uniref:4-hydroxy-tetrahydrodipicolinate reductase n=1 Tax=Lyticum sinuosum TaxID=1332059 RepID=A0AAE4VL44_9RICK|nr:4-hydroxy-tetrahydrodipicolinate reductase [Lyticum sinuosum]MDZ5761152.1 4-hydroxy-tetrahydrodipicolinate reductase [Lyticum sinuosum]
MNKKNFYKSYSIGIIGATGKMGKEIISELNINSTYTILDKQIILTLGPSYSSSSKFNIKEVFESNDCIIDFSNKSLLNLILDTVENNPKPLIIGTTGWDPNDFSDKLKRCSNLTPIIIAPNTSIGSFAQKFISLQLASIIGEYSDIDILERHHRNKKDSPSGTALELKRSLEEKLKYNNKNSNKSSNLIPILSCRSGSIVGEHTINFTTDNEMITITHRVFDRKAFVQGVIKSVLWLLCKELYFQNNLSENCIDGVSISATPGLYTIDNVLEL